MLISQPLSIPQSLIKLVNNDLFNLMEMRAAERIRKSIEGKGFGWFRFGFFEDRKRLDKIAGYITDVPSMVFIL